MNIEIGKTYQVSNLYKKSVVERTFYQNDNGVFLSKDIVWRSGTVFITPRNEDEVDLITQCLEEGEEGELEVTSFEDWELNDTYDGCAEDYSVMQGEFDIDALQEQYDELDEDERDEYWDFGAYLEANGFEETDMEMYFEAGIIVEEYDE